MADRIEPFAIAVDEAALDDLRDRLRRTRWPERETVGDWSQGIPLAYLRELCGYWSTRYDWPAAVTRLNRIPQFTTTIDGLPVHFLHIRSPHRGAVPLIMTHGWPGSFLEFEQTLGPLADPAAHGGDPADAFHVVVPSLPGYGSTSLALQHPGRLLGIHLVPPLAPPGRHAADLTDAERAAVADLDERTRSGSGYSAEHGTRPQTIGWLTGTAASSARLYWESIAQVTEWFTVATSDTITVPIGCSVFPKEVPRPSRRWAERRFANIVYWSEPERGGHFAAWEQPELFTDEVRAVARACAQVP